MTKINYCSIFSKTGVLWNNGNSDFNDITLYCQKHIDILNQSFYNSFEDCFFLIKNGIGFLCSTDEDFPTNIAMKFLQDLSGRYSIRPNLINDIELEALIKHFSKLGNESTSDTDSGKIKCRIYNGTIESIIENSNEIYKEEIMNTSWSYPKCIIS